MKSKYYRQNARIEFPSVNWLNVIAGAVVGTFFAVVLFGLYGWVQIITDALRSAS